MNTDLEESWLSRMCGAVLAIVATLSGCAIMVAIVIAALRWALE